MPPLPPRVKADGQRRRTKHGSPVVGYHDNKGTLEMFDDYYYYLLYFIYICIKKNKKVNVVVSKKGWNNNNINKEKRKKNRKLILCVPLINQCVYVCVHVWKVGCLLRLFSVRPFGERCVHEIVGFACTGEACKGTIRVGEGEVLDDLSSFFFFYIWW